MFLSLNHKELPFYQAARALTLTVYSITAKFPNKEEYNLVRQINRAVISVHLNLAEGSSRSSILERRRFYEIARGSLVEIDAAMDLANELGYLEGIETKQLNIGLNTCFKHTSNLIASCQKK
ncbi:MAG: four helix bundle protein [Chitinophagales bacterium]